MCRTQIEKTRTEKKVGLASGVEGEAAVTVWRKIWETISPTTTLARTGGWEIVGWKYTVQFLIALAALVAVYYFMGWEMP